MRRMTGRQVMAAMIRKLPDGQRGQRSMSRENRRLSKRAHAQRDETGLACVSIPCWRGVGVMAPRSLLCAAKQPAYRTWCTRGGGTHAANFSNSSNGDSLMPVVPSDQGWVNV